MNYRRNTEKNEELIASRGVSFDDMLDAIQSGGLIDIIPHPNVIQYPHQEMYIVHCKGYVYTIPFVYESTDSIFLKTIIPQRKYKKIYLD